MYKLFQLWPLRALSISSFDILPTMCVSLCAHTCACTLSYFLVLQDAPYSSSIFPAPVLESTISLRNLGSFCWKNQDLGPKCVCCQWDTLLLGPFNWQSMRYMCLYFILISLNISMCNHLCPYWAKHAYNWCLQPKSITWIFLAPFPCLSINFPSNSEKPGSHHQPSNYLLSIPVYMCGGFRIVNPHRKQLN